MAVEAGPGAARKASRSAKWAWTGMRGQLLPRANSSMVGCGEVSHCHRRAVSRPRSRPAAATVRATLDITKRDCSVNCSANVPSLRACGATPVSKSLASWPAMNSQPAALIAGVYGISGFSTPPGQKPWGASVPRAAAWPAACAARPSGAASVMPAAAPWIKRRRFIMVVITVP